MHSEGPRRGDEPPGTRPALPAELPGTSSIRLVRELPDLKPYGGTVLKTSLPHDAEQQLMKALHGDDPSAPTWQQPASAGATT